VLGVEVFDDGAAGGPAGHDVGGQIESGAAGALPGGGGVAAVVAAHHEVREVAAGQVAGGEAHAGGARVQPVDPVHPPAPLVGVVGDEVPASRPHDQVVGFQAQGGREVGFAGGGAGAVGAQDLRGEGVALPHGGADGAQRGGVDRGCGELPVVAQRGQVQGFHGGAEGVGHGLAQGHQGSGGVVPHAEHGAGGALQGDGDRERLVVVEQQGRQGVPGAEAVAAVGAADGHHRVSEVAQGVQVASHGAVADLQPFGEVPQGPGAAGAEQRQQSQRSVGRRRHHLIVPAVVAIRWPVPPAPSG
jgi:hypothetical protein